MPDRYYSVKEVLKLEKRRFREDEGVFLVEGKKILLEALASGFNVTQVLVTEKFSHTQREFIEENKLGQKRLTTISDHNEERLSSTATPPGILAIVEKPALQFSEVLESSFVVAMDNIRDPGNLGTMIRTADWFGVKTLIVSAEGVDPYNDKVVRATMGSLFHLKIYISDSLVDDLQELKKAHFTLITTRPEVKSNPVPQKEKMCLIMGNESVGTSPEVDELADIAYAIPKYGQAESLNVAVSFGILLNELVPKFRL